jgi:hypothetical protein
MNYVELPVVEPPVFVRAVATVLNPRAIINGLLFSAPFWALIFAVAWGLLR